MIKGGRSEGKLSVVFTALMNTQAHQDWQRNVQLEPKHETKPNASRIGYKKEIDIGTRR